MSSLFSGKKKKALMQAKRKTQRERGEPEAEAVQPAPARKLKTVLQREDQAAVLAGRADATRPLQLQEAALRGLLPAWPVELQPPISLPLRPPWSYTDSAPAVEARESATFKAWEEELLTRVAPGSELSRYEKNLEVWRQLWRTLEVSDALLLIVDARTPLISFPAPLYEEAVRRRLPCICLLNKADLLPASVADAWAAHLRQRFPGLSFVLCFRADPGAAPKGFKGGGPRKAGFKRWRAGGEVVRSDVEALTRCIMALPVLRDGAESTFQDFWGAEATTQEAEQELPQAAEEEEALAAAALVQSEAWAARLASAGEEGAAEGRRQQYVTLGVVGEPNMGKSAVINRLFRAPVVKASPTPGCTKHLQTLFLRPQVRLADCPGLIFPKVGVPLGMQLLCGNHPIAQAREPFATVRYLAEAGVHPPLPSAYGLSLGDVSEHSSRVAGQWSPYALCEALAVKRSFLTRGGGADVFRAANRILRDALAGKNIRLAFVPPGMLPCAWPPNEGAAEVQAEASSQEEEGEDAESDEGDGGACANPFAALGEEE